MKMLSNMYGWQRRMIALGCMAVLALFSTQSAYAMHIMEHVSKILSRENQIKHDSSFR